MNSLHMLRIENAPMHDSAIYCILHMKSAKTYRPPRGPRKKRFKYADIYYDETLRTEIMKGQNGVCLLDDDKCSKQLHLHHIDKDKHNNLKNNLIFLCKEHHFGVHKNKYRIPIGGIN